MFYFELKMNHLRINGVMLLLSFICILIQHRSTKADTNTIQWNTDAKAPHEIRYNWTKPDFIEVRYNRIQICTDIPTKKTQKSKWRVCLHPHGIENFTHSYIGLRFQLVNCGDEFKKTIVKFKASVIDNEHRETESKEEVKEFNADINEICWEEFCEGDDRKYIQYKLLKNGALTIFIRISYYIECSKHTTSLGPNIVKCDLFNDLDSLLKDPIHADVELQLRSNGKEYYAHRAILAARSGHFAREFKYFDFDKVHKRIYVDIANTDEEIMNEILRYIYTGKCEIYSDEMAERLFVAADEYELKGLKTLCSQFMCDELSVENAAKMLVLADKYPVDEFKSNVVSFIVENSFQVLNTTDWKNLVESNHQLLREMCAIFAHRLSSRNDRTT
ncbi:speckle-type POZ protein-like [Planococcus citri]|uniref:speckle-type POZ protein-like n=1 Tax=Planococcus citri TaxID=170843 RepID=UPI0031F84099